MGRDKALLEVGGVALATRVARVLGQATEEVVLLGRGPVPVELERLRRVADVQLAAAGREGPLAGILAALRAEPEAAWVVCPCDLPHVTEAAVAWLLDQRRPGVAAVLPRVVRDDGEPVPQPLFAVYEPAARHPVEQLVAAGLRGPRHLAGRTGVVSPRVPPELAAAWRDADTPGDLETARRRLEGLPGAD